MRYSKKINFAFAIGFIFIIYLALFGAGSSVNMEYFIASRQDGGYSLNIILYKRYWKLITAEGIFPKQRLTHTIEIIGKGKDWMYRNQKGYFYSLNEIKSSYKRWDIGYAWIDVDMDNIYRGL